MSSAEVEKYVTENQALKCELRQCSDRYQKSELEKEQLLKRIEEIEKENRFYQGQIEAYKYCIDNIRR